MEVSNVCPGSHEPSLVVKQYDVEVIEILLGVEVAGNKCCTQSSELDAIGDYSCFLCHAGFHINHLRCDGFLYT